MKTLIGMMSRKCCTSSNEMGRCQTPVPTARGLAYIMMLWKQSLSWRVRNCRFFCDSLPSIHQGIHQFSSASPNEMERCQTPVPSTARGLAYNACIVMMWKWSLSWSQELPILRFVSVYSPGSTPTLIQHQKYLLSAFFGHNNITYTTSYNKTAVNIQAEIQSRLTIIMILVRFL